MIIRIGFEGILYYKEPPITIKAPILNPYNSLIIAFLDPRNPPKQKRELFRPLY